MKKKRENGRLKSFSAQVKEHKGVFALYVILRILVLGIGVEQFLLGRYENVFMCILTLLLFLLPAFVESKFKVKLPDTLEICVLLFIFAAEILGEIGEYYVTVPMWDTLLHTVTGFIAAAIGFSLVNILNESPRFTFSLSPLFVSLVAFCFSMSIGVLWEFFEFAADFFLHTDMQKDTVLNALSSVMLNPDGANSPVRIDGITSVIINGNALPVKGYLDIGLYDTMKDMFVNFIGAVVFSSIGYFYIKSRGTKHKIVENITIKPSGGKENGEQ